MKGRYNFMRFKKGNLENIKNVIVTVTPVITIAASLLSAWSGDYSRKKIISAEVSKQFKKLNIQKQKGL